MDDDPVLASVRQWLSRNGYVLEMEVAQEVSTHATWTWQGESYPDPVTGKIRELDVWAMWAQYPKDDNPAHSLSVFFECKHSTAPWVLFTGNTEQDAARALGNFAGDCEMCTEIDNGVGLLMHAWGPDAYAVTEKRDKSDGSANGRDHAREAMHQAVSATLGKLDATQEETGHVERTFSTIGIPVVVTKSPLVVCTLTDNAQVDLRLTDRATTEILVPGKNEGVHDSYGVFVVQFSALQEFLSEIDQISIRFKALDKDSPVTPTL